MWSKIACYVVILLHMTSNRFHVEQNCFSCRAIFLHKVCTNFHVEQNCFTWKYLLHGQCPQRPRQISCMYPPTYLSRSNPRDLSPTKHLIRKCWGDMTRPNKSFFKSVFLRFKIKYTETPCEVLPTRLRDYRVGHFGWIFGKLPNGLWPPPPM